MWMWTPGKDYDAPDPPWIPGYIPEEGHKLKEQMGGSQPGEARETLAALGGRGDHGGSRVPRKPRRRDLQVVASGRGRGSRAAALAAASELAGGDTGALLELEEGKPAPSSRGPKKARLSFVEDLILNATGGLYPLTVFRIRAGAACLKRGGYRAAAGYLGEAKQGHCLLYTSPSPRDRG